jgi:hypothetical protein
MGDGGRHGQKPSVVHRPLKDEPAALSEAVTRGESVSAGGLFNEGEATGHR